MISNETILAIVCDHYLETGRFLTAREIASRLGVRAKTIHATLDACVFHGLQKITPPPAGRSFYGPTLPLLREAFHAKES